MSNSIHIPSASGFCANCETLHSLGGGNSRTYARELMAQLEKHNRIDFSREWDHPPRPAGTPPVEGNSNNPRPRRGGRNIAMDGVGNLNPEFSTDYLWGDARGQMFGVLECKDAAGRTVVLKAFSCQYNGEWLVDGWVPPLFDVDAFHQLTQPVYQEINALGLLIQGLDQSELERSPLIEQRAALSRNLMKEIHDLYRLTNFNGETKPLSDILGKRQGIPAGTGDCCAPKLLNYAALNGLKPIGLSEFYWGKESKSGARQHREFYPACKEKCQPILGFMLCESGKRNDGTTEQWNTGRMEYRNDGMMGKRNTGNFPSAFNHFTLPIIHSDSDFVVVVKPSGLLSVPGKGPKNQDCVTARIKALYPNCPDHPEVHRLDMDTSGLIVVALNKKSHRELSRQFHDRETKKRYIALLDGELQGDEGTIELPFRLDVDNRPRQIYDPVHGKIGITHWKTLSADPGKTRVEFTPITGRTHQLRVHAASEHGLGVPIIGDRLYGTGTAPGQLKLHACFLSFTHPRTGERMRFNSEPPF